MFYLFFASDSQGAETQAGAQDTVHCSAGPGPHCQTQGGKSPASRGFFDDMLFLLQLSLKYRCLKKSTQKKQFVQ